jgi:radical SAM protein with 4Fe4S-binding SPASM domain
MMNLFIRAWHVLGTVTRSLYKIMRKEINYLRFKPTHALFFITYRCTCRCKSCTMWQRQGKTEEELSLDEWKKVVDAIAERGLQDIELFGGDALLRMDVLIPLIRYIDAKGIHTNITVNGSLLDKPTAVALVESGLDDFNISVDAIGALHDSLRGVDGLFEKAKQGIAYVVEARGKRVKPEIALNATISAANFDQIDGLIEAARSWGMDTVNLEPYGAIPEESVAESCLDGRKPQPYFLPAEKPMYFTREQAVALKAKLADIKTNPGYKGIYITSDNIDVLSVDQLVSGIFPNKRCYICRYLIFIDPYGNVLPCSFFDSYILGNIRQENFRKIWANRRHRQFVTKQNAGELPMCRHCVFGVQRNRTLGQALTGLYLSITKKAR